jgi:hypothetical protein
MDAETFFDLHGMLFPVIGSSFIAGSATSKKQHRNGARNGLVPSSTTRLGAAIRYFAGGSPYDLAVMFGISVKEVYTSVWKVVYAVNTCPSLKVEFPSDHGQQKAIAKRFQARSKAKFDCCLGAIDGMLLWIEKPPDIVCASADCGPGRFYCGRKKKYGLNFMATCDDKCRFLDIEIRHPGSASDYLAFATSHLKTKLEEPGFLAPGLVIFGDNGCFSQQHHQKQQQTRTRRHPTMQLEQATPLLCSVVVGGNSRSNNNKNNDKWTSVSRYVGGRVCQHATWGKMIGGRLLQILFWQFCQKS